MEKKGKKAKSNSRSQRRKPLHLQVKGPKERGGERMILHTFKLRN